MLHSFSSYKKNPALPREIYQDSVNLLNTNHNQFELCKFSDLFAKVQTWFDMNVEHLLDEITNIPKGKKQTAKRYLKIKELVERSPCFQGTLEINELCLKFINILDYKNSKQFIIIIEMYYFISSLLKKIDDTPICGTLLHKTLLLRAHRLTSYLCLAMTNAADTMHKILPNEAKEFYQNAIFFGELCVHYQECIFELSFDTPSELLTVTTETLGFLTKCYSQREQYSLAAQTLFEMHSLIVKHKMNEFITTTLVVNVCQNVYRACFEKLVKSEHTNETLMVLQQVVRLTQRYVKSMDDFKVNTKLFSSDAIKEALRKYKLDLYLAYINYSIVVTTDILKKASIVDNTVVITFPDFISKQQIEREIRKLKVIENTSLKYDFDSNKVRFKAENFLHIDLVSLIHLNNKLTELSSGSYLIEESQEAQQVQKTIQVQALQQHLDPSAPPPESKPAVTAAAPVQEPPVEVLTVKLEKSLSLKQKKTLPLDEEEALAVNIENSLELTRVESSRSLALSKPTIQYGKDFGFKTPPFKDAVCNKLRKGIYVLYSPGEFYVDEGCDKKTQARFEQLAANPQEARKFDCNGFKMWATRSKGGKPVHIIEGKIVTSPLRLLAIEETCTNDEGETGYYFNTIQNTKKGKAENKYKVRKK